jgi:hypothetical protein
VPGSHCIESPPEQEGFLYILFCYCERTNLNTWWVYIVEKKKKFYIDITTDISNRMRQHGNPEPLYKEGPMKIEETMSIERTLKG